MSTRVKKVSATLWGRKEFPERRSAGKLAAVKIGKLIQNTKR